MAKRLRIEDATVGMAYQTQVERARATLLQAETAYQLFIENLRLRYKAPEGQWELSDWAEGFAPIETDGGHDDAKDD